VLSERARRTLFAAIGAAIVLAFYLFFTVKSVGRYFDNDDMMNLYLAWSKPLSEVFRPIGGLFYRAMYAVAGFDPRPFRVACLVIGAVNIGLCWRFAWLASGSEAAAAFAGLLFAFHSRLMEVWFRTAVVYDSLCFLFFYSAACLYLEARRRGRMPGSWVSIGILALFVCALGAKEVAMALPAVLLAYEVLFEWKARWRRPALIAGMFAVNIPYLWVKTHGAAAMTNNPAYRSEYTGQRFSEIWALFLNFLFILKDPIKPWMAVSILAGMLLVAIAARSRRLMFAWCVAVFPALPISFLPYRGAYVLYLAYAGWVLYAGCALASVCEWVAGREPRVRMAFTCVMFVLLGWWWGKRNLHDQRLDSRLWLYRSADQVRSLVDAMRTLKPRLPRGAHVLFLEDAFGTDEWTPYFVVKLLYHDDTLLVDRIKMMDQKPGDWGTYHYVVAYEGGQYRLAKP